MMDSQRDKKTSGLVCLFLVDEDAVYSCCGALQNNFLCVRVS